MKCYSFWLIPVILVIFAFFYIRDHKEITFNNMSYSQKCVLAIIEDGKRSDRHLLNYCSKKELSQLENSGFLTIYRSGDTYINDKGIDAVLKWRKHQDKFQGLLDELGISTEDY